MGQQESQEPQLPNMQQQMPLNQQSPTQQQMPSSRRQQMPLNQQSYPTQQQMPSSYDQDQDQQSYPEQQQYPSSSPFQQQSQQIEPEFINYNSLAYQQRVQKREQIKQNMTVTKKTPVQEEQRIVDPEEKRLALLLIEKAATGDPQSISSLLNDGVNPNISNENGDYAIHVVMKRADFKLDFLKKFFDENYQYEVNINAKDKKGQTILHLACKMDNPDVSQYLLSKGADPNTQDKDGNTCLHLLATKPERSEVMLQQCLDYGANIEISNNAMQNCNQMTSNTSYHRLFVEQKLNFNEDVTGGDVEVALSWNNLNDLDLHCRCKCGTQIFYSNKKCHDCRGFLDFDMNVNPTNTDPRLTSRTPVEHIYWPHIVPGVYTLSVILYRWHTANAPLETDFLIVMKVKDNAVFEKSFRLDKEKGEVTVLQFEFDKDGKWKHLK